MDFKTWNEETPKSSREEKKIQSLEDLNDLSFDPQRQQL